MLWLAGGGSRESVIPAPEPESRCEKKGESKVSNPSGRVFFDLQQISDN
jgi:hypothetical protein